MTLLDRILPRRSAAASVEMVEADIMVPPSTEIVAVRQTVPSQTVSTERVVWAGGRIQGAWMTHDEALRLSAVWACVTVIAKSIAGCDWNVFREAMNGDREYLRFNQLFWLLNVSPNPESRAFAVREAMLIQALIGGNAYAEIERDQIGRPVALWPIEDYRCTLERNRETNRLQLRVANEGQGDALLDYDDVFHLHGPGCDGVAGYDVVNIAARGMAHARAAEVYGSAYYMNGTSPGGVITATAKLTELQKDELRTTLNAKHQGPEKAFKFLLLEGGQTFTPLQIDNDAAQFIETRYLLIEEICRWFGVPPHKIAHLLRATNNNIEHQGLEFTRDALTPWCRRLEQEANWKLVMVNSVWTEIDLEPLTWGDAKSRAETDVALVRGGIVKRNEARRRRGLNSLGPDGDQITVEQGLTTLGRLANGLPAIDVPEPPPALPAPAEPAEPEEDGEASAARRRFEALMGTVHVG